MGFIFYIVDVFAERKYVGNQLAVFRNVQGLSYSEMQQIAREMNYSETTFILSDKKQKNGFQVRIFTPKEEIPFAGHPVLGTAYVIQREIIRKTVQEVRLDLKIGQIPVTSIYYGGDIHMLWMRQHPPIFGQTFDPKALSHALGLQEDDIDFRFPIQAVSTGLPFIITPIRTLCAIKGIHVDKDAYFELIKNTEAKAILVFSPQTYDTKNDLNVRVFVDYYGIPEDPATGSGNGCLAAYLAKHQYFGQKKVDIRVEQGYEVGRPSLIFLKSEMKDGRIDVSVGGKVIMVAKGEFI